MENKEYQTFGQEWKIEINKLPKGIIIDLLSKKGLEYEALQFAEKIIIKDYNEQIEQMKGALRFLCSKEHIEQDAYTAHVERYINHFNL